jgi:hypothetical protein
MLGENDTEISSVITGFIDRTAVQIPEGEACANEGKQGKDGTDDPYVASDVGPPRGDDRWSGSHARAHKGAARRGSCHRADGLVCDSIAVKSITNTIGLSVSPAPYCMSASIELLVDVAEAFDGNVQYFWIGLLLAFPFHYLRAPLKAITRQRPNQSVFRPDRLAPGHDGNGLVPTQRSS